MREGWLETMSVRFPQTKSGARISDQYFILFLTLVGCFTSPKNFWEERERERERDKVFLIG